MNNNQYSKETNMRRMTANLTTGTKLLAVMLMAGTALVAAPVWHQPITIDQPDGSSIQCYVTGDEFYQRVYDASNYTIIRDPASGYCVYAQRNGEELVPSPYRAGTADPQQLGIEPGLDITDAQKNQLRHRFPYMANEGAKSPTTGTINNIVVFIHFADQTEFTDSISYYDRMFNDNLVNNSSMYDYFVEASYNSLFVPSTFYPLPAAAMTVSFQDSHNRGYFCPYNAVSNPGGYHNDTELMNREHTLLKDAIDAISSQVPAGLNIDADGDDMVDNVCFIIRGDHTAWADLLWPHRWALYSQTAYINGKRVWDYNLQLELFLKEDEDVGVLSHEMSHSVGYPDLYHYYYGTNLWPCGTWDVMDYGGDPPPHMDAYMKNYYTGWIADIPEITAPGTYWLKPLTSATNNCYRIASPFSSTEYFVVEYRRKAGQFEISLPGSGLLVYRINSDFAGWGNADYDGSSIFDEVYIYRPGGTPSVNGNTYIAHFNSTVGRTAINDGTNPSSFLHEGSAGGLNITAIGAAGDSIQFTVSSLTGVEEEPITAAPPMTAPGQVSFSPNPTAAKGLFSFQVATPGRVRIAIYSITGQLVRVVADGQYQAGNHRVAWDGRDGTGKAVAAGVYCYRTTSGGCQRSGRIAVVR